MGSAFVEGAVLACGAEAARGGGDPAAVCAKDVLAPRLKDTTVMSMRMVDSVEGTLQSRAPGRSGAVTYATMWWWGVPSRRALGDGRLSDGE
jgi:hypothetical protein